MILSAVASADLMRLGVAMFVDRTVGGRKMIDNTLTGRRIGESTLGRVPRAANADTVSGLTVRKVFYAPTDPTDTVTTILSLGGLSLRASCAGGTVAIIVKSAADNSSLFSQMRTSDGTATGRQSDGLHHADYDIASTDDLTDQFPWGETSFTYTRSHTIVSGELSFTSSNLIQDGTIFNSAAACLVSGFAISTAAA